MDGDKKNIDEEVISIQKLNLIALISSVLIGAIIFLPYILIWNIGEINFYFITKVFILHILLIFTHEILHAIGFYIFGNVKFKDIKVGIQKGNYTPYAHCKKPITISSYRISLLLPLIFLGIIPTLVALVIGNSLLIVLGTLMIIGSVGDIAILWVIRSYSGDKFIEDHPHKIGCIILN